MSDPQPIPPQTFQPGGVVQAPTPPPAAPHTEKKDVPDPKSGDLFWAGSGIACGEHNAVAEPVAEGWQSDCDACNERLASVREHNLKHQYAPVDDQARFLAEHDRIQQDLVTGQITLDEAKARAAKNDGTVAAEENASA